MAYQGAQGREQQPGTVERIQVVNAMGQEMAKTAGNVEFAILHGSTDAPTVDVIETGAGAGTIVDDLMYGDYAGYLELPTASSIDCMWAERPGNMATTSTDHGLRGHHSRNAYR